MLALWEGEPDGQGLPGVFVSLFLSRLADQILLFIVPLLVFQTTQSASWTGLAFFVETLPRFIAFPIGGALCDRFSPVRLLHLSQAFRALACVIAVGGHGLFDGLYWLVALSALCGVLTTQGIMAREVLLPHVFTRYSYTKTLSYSQIADQTGLVLGPLLAALLLQAMAWHWVVLGVAGLFVLADLAMRVWQRTSVVYPANHRATAFGSLATAAAHRLRAHPGFGRAASRSSALRSGST